MNKALVAVALLLAGNTVLGQNIPTDIEHARVSMKEFQWKHEPGQVEFTTHRNTPAIRVLGDSLVFLKEMPFKDGTIEFDVEFTEHVIAGISFRHTKITKDHEYFYIRPFWPMNRLNRTSVQYTTVVDDVLLWDLTDDYQTAALITMDGPNHVKLVVSGRQMRVYVNDMTKPTLYIPALEGPHGSGSIALRGKGAISSNLIIRPGVVEGLPREEGFDPTAHDTRYLRQWLVTQPVDFPFGQDISQEDLPNPVDGWTAINAERRSLVNVSRQFGRSEKSGARRIVWLKTTIQSVRAQERRVDLGFSDEVWVYLNG